MIYQYHVTIFIVQKNTQLGLWENLHFYTSQGTQIKKKHKWQLWTNMFQAEIWYTILFHYWGMQCSNAQYSSTVVVGCAVSFHSRCFIMFMCVCDHIMLIVLTHTVCLCCVFSPRQVDSNIVNILRQRKLECMQWEGPDAKYKCKKVSDDYDEAATNWFIKCNFILSSSSIVVALFVFANGPFSFFQYFLLFWMALNSQMMVGGRCSLLPCDMALVFAIMHGDLKKKSPMYG